MGLCLINRELVFSSSLARTCAVGVVNIVHQRTLSTSFATILPSSPSPCGFKSGAVVY